MNMKNTVILLIFLLSLLGLIMGIIYTESEIGHTDAGASEEMIDECDNGTIIITIEAEPQNSIGNMLT